MTERSFTHAAEYEGDRRRALRVRVEGAEVGPLVQKLAVASGAIDEHALHTDDLTLTEWMLDRGHLEGTMLHRVDVETHEIVVTYALTPGPVYRLRAFDVSEGGQPVVGWIAPFKPGEVFSRGALMKALRAVRLAYHDLGYANVEADADTSIVRDKNEVTVKIAVTRNELVLFENVVVAGNKTVATDDIRAKLAVKGGDPFSESALAASRTALIATKWFEQVDVSVSPGTTKGRVVAQIVVREAASD